MKRIVITTDDIFPNEVERIEALLSNGIDLVHLRKPTWDMEQFEALITSIEPCYHSRLVIHSHFELCTKYMLHGIHLGRNRMDIPQDHKGSVSYSCHSIEELAQSKHYDYCTLSPIFNSISKKGYNAAFSHEELQNAAANGIIDHKTFALGGITFDKIKALETLGFGGACILGDAWK